jgi:hypothetical protein
MEPITHGDVIVVLAVIFATTLIALIGLAVFFERSLAESRRLNKAVGALMLQEAEKIRALVRDQS